MAGPTLWNKLPPDMRTITDLGLFKARLKTYLFRLAFNVVKQCCDILVHMILLQKCKFLVLAYTFVYIALFCFYWKALWFTLSAV